MGSAASVIMDDLPDLVSEDQVKQVAGLYWDKKKFDHAKDGQGFVPKAYLSKVVEDRNDRLKQKYSNISPFERDLWEPFIHSKYYNAIYSIGQIQEYCAASKEKRREMLFSSFTQLNIFEETLRCRGSCGNHFHEVIK